MRARHHSKATELASLAGLPRTPLPVHPARSPPTNPPPSANASLSLPQFIDTLLGTLVKELQNKYTPGRREEAVDVTMRFLRSVARVFVILSVEMASSKKKKYVCSRRLMQDSELPYFPLLRAGADYV